MYQSGSYIFICLNYVIVLVRCQLATWSTIYDSPITRDPQPGWARFCKNENVYDAFASQCPVGVFWDDSSDSLWDCVCTRGPWRRSAGWCTGEETQRFTQGDVTCFEPDPEEKPGLQALYYVGDRFSSWDSSLPILLSDYNSGIPIRKGDLRIQWEISSRTKKNPGVLIYRPRDDWAMEDKNNNGTKLCLRAPSTFNEETEGLFIYSVSSLFDSSGDSLKFQMVFTRGCYSWNENETIQWQDVLGENLQEKNMIVPTYNYQSSSEKCVKCMSKPIPPAPEADIDGEALEEREEFTIHDLKNVAVLRTEIDLQTERLGHYWAHIMLLNGSDYIAGDFQEIDLLVKAAVLAYNVCDKTKIPFNFYKYFLTMFKMLLSESFKKYPPKGPISPEYYAKIIELLNKCKSRKLDVKFTLSETCPSIFEEFTVAPEEPKKINITSDYASDKGRHDFLLEFVWRLKSFLHYNCFPEFKSDTILLDVVQNQLESLFTEDLVLRWYNPGNSFQMFSMIFENHFDLESVMQNFQRCIIAIHESSNYPVWLKRPIDRPETLPRKGSGGVSSRLKRSIRRTETQTQNVRGYRKKREADSEDDYEYDDEDEYKPPNNLFGGSAACIKSITTFMTESQRTSNGMCW